MQPKNGAAGSTLRVWDLPLRLFHWLLVGAITAAFLSAFESSPIAPWHQAAGWVAAVLIAFRIVWGFVGGEHARFGALRLDRLGHHLGELLRRRAKPSLGHNPLGAVAIAGLLLLTVVTIWTGALIGPGGEEDAHEAVAYALLALVAVHVVAVAAMSLLTGENLIRAMVTGRKPAVRHPEATDAKDPGVWALLVGAVAIAAAAYGATRIDPIAFSPHPVSERGAQTDRGPGASGDAAAGERETEGEAR